MLDIIVACRSGDGTISQPVYLFSRRILCSFYESVPDETRWTVLIEALREIDKGRAVIDLGLEELEREAKENKSEADTCELPRCHDHEGRIFFLI